MNLYSFKMSVLIWVLVRALAILIHRTYGLMSRLKDKAIMVKSLAQGHKCHDWDLNPYSSEQKHQSLSPVLLTTGPRDVTEAGRQSIKQPVKQPVLKVQAVSPKNYVVDKV